MQKLTDETVKVIAQTVSDRFGASLTYASKDECKQSNDLLCHKIELMDRDFLFKLFSCVYEELGDDCFPCVLLDDTRNAFAWKLEHCYIIGLRLGLIADAIAVPHHFTMFSGECQRNCVNSLDLQCNG